jgi:hypothetical protein
VEGLGGDGEVGGREVSWGLTLVPELEEQQG